MITSSINEPFKYNIWDPSYSKNGSYWQLPNVFSSTEADLWRQVVNCISNELPKRESDIFKCTETDRSHAFMGCLNWKNQYWAYRFFLTGRDGQNRPGRYFIAIFNLNDLNAIKSPQFSGIIKYLSSLTSIPLELNELNGEIIGLDILPETATLLNVALKTNPNTHSGLLVQKGIASPRTYGGLKLPAAPIKKSTQKSSSSHSTSSSVPILQTNIPKSRGTLKLVLFMGAILAIIGLSYYLYREIYPPAKTSEFYIEFYDGEDSLHRVVMHVPLGAELKWIPAGKSRPLADSESTVTIKFPDGKLRVKVENLGEEPMEVPVEQRILNKTGTSPRGGRQD
jgi:hypothetical protein